MKPIHIFSISMIFLTSFNFSSCKEEGCSSISPIVDGLINEKLHIHVEGNGLLCQEATTYHWNTDCELLDVFTTFSRIEGIINFTVIDADNNIVSEYQLNDNSADSSTSNGNYLGVPGSWQVTLEVIRFEGEFEIIIEPKKDDC